MKPLQLAVGYSERQRYRGIKPIQRYRVHVEDDVTPSAGLLFKIIQSKMKAIKMVIRGGTVRILIADDHPLYLLAVRDQMTRLYPGVSIECGSDLDEVMSGLSRESHYDLILLDYSMPGMVGAGSVRMVVGAAQGAPVVVMSGIALADDVSHCIGCGAKGFLPKTLDGKIFGSALSLILGGGSYLPAEMFSSPLADLPPPPRAGEAGPLRDFSERERGIMSMVVEGKSNKEIARQLNLREVTIKVQLTHIYRKLGAKNRAQAAMLVSRGN